MRFSIAGDVHDGSVLVFPERTLSWPVADVGQITLDSLLEISPGEGSADLLVVGCGAQFQPLPEGLKAGLKEWGVALEWMDTGAACRTFNVLLAEDRALAAALIAVE